ncbi:restriction endonuclease subunit S [Selenomonas bovis]|uniref:restriction endonuclease subunit S n=1 Tax=Selenomonas bovis TaxID=416586 RepID=UPI003AB91DE6
MAKKKQALSPEERLAAALVPEEEWPYALPDGWKWVRLGKIYDVNPKVQADDDLEASFVTMSDISPGIKSQFDFIVRKWGEIKKGHTQFANGDVAFAKISPCFENRKSMILDGLKNGIGAGTTELIVLRNPSIDNKYTFLFISSEEFIRHARNTYKGVVGQQRINLDFVKNYPMPLPPLSEQRRLVARIESLFAKLDAAREKVQSVLDSHETRKAALLHAAFTGKLTAKWREEQGESSHAWRIEKLENLCDKITCGKTPKNDISPQGEIPYLKVYNIVNDKIDFRSKPQYISRDVHETKLKSSILKPNDVIMNIVGPPLRKIAIIPDTYPEWNMNQAIVRFRPKEGLDYHFLYYALLNPETLDDVVQRTKGVVGQANISITQSRNLKIKVPPLPEQQQIVRILDRLLAREQRARQAAEETLAAIDRMKQSILARAFRGEL